MATKQYPFTTPANYIYDSDKIEVSGGVAKLKEDLTNVYARWHLNEATGATVLDTSGNGRDGTPVNSLISVVGKLNNCLQFNGTTQYVNCGDIANFERTDKFSIEGWVKLTVKGIIVGREQWVSPYRGWYVGTNPSGWLQFVLTNTWATNQLSVYQDAVNMLDDVWHHFIITYDGSSSNVAIKFYVDGLIRTTKGNPSTLTATIQNSKNCQIAGADGANEVVTGLVDEIIIYDRVLTQSELSFKWNSGVGIERQPYYTLSKIYAHYHLNSIGLANSVEDVSGNNRDGLAINSPSIVGGKLNTCFLFNGTNQCIDLGDIANFDRINPFSLEAWIKTSLSSTQIIVARIDDGLLKGWQLDIRTGIISLTLANSVTNYIWVTTVDNSFADNSWHHVIMTYDGSSSASGIHIYVDDNDETLTINQDTLTATIQNSIDCYIACKVGTGYFNGYIDEVAIYEKELNQSEVTFRNNSGAGREEASFAPIIKPTTSWSPVEATEWTEFNELLGGGNEGNVAYQLSDDDGVTWLYWNGSAWVIAGEEKYNDAQTIEDNATAITEHEKIMFKAFLISNEIQQVELDNLEIIAITGEVPIVYAGTDKSCYDNQQIKPFSDATISDPDGDIELAHAYYDIEGSGWIEITKGGYGTLQEAIRNFQYTFNNIGIINCQLKVIDYQVKETIDDLNVTVQKYTVTFNVKDSLGNHLPNIHFKPGDGTGYQIKHSPFTYGYDYNVSGYDIIIDKDGYSIQTQNVPSTIHIENFTLVALIDTSEFASDLKRLLGLTHENFRLTSVDYDIVGSMTSCKIRIYANATDCENNTNHIAEYEIACEYSDGRLINYKSKKV